MKCMFTWAPRKSLRCRGHTGPIHLGWERSRASADGYLVRSNIALDVEKDLLSATSCVRASSTCVSGFWHSYQFVTSWQYHILVTWCDSENLRFGSNPIANLIVRSAKQPLDLAYWTSHHLTLLLEFWHPFWAGSDVDRIVGYAFMQQPWCSKMGPFLSCAVLVHDTAKDFPGYGVETSWYVGHTSQQKGGQMDEPF